jgi:hypothetical protein
VFNSSERSSTFPTTTVKYHDKFGARGAVVSFRRNDHTTFLYDVDDTDVHMSLFPEEQFLRKCAELGFNRNPVGHPLENRSGRARGFCEREVD